jgi:hypothetical protein
MQLVDLGIIIKIIGIIYLFILLINGEASIPLPVIIIITVGYLISAISCNSKLLSPSVKHHKIVEYFIGLLGIIFIIKYYRNNNYVSVFL